LKVIEKVSEMQALADAWREEKQKIGFVPTMGALHEGHLSLIRRARELCDRVVVSIFVNPTQFGPAEDFAKYPRPIEADSEWCRREGVDTLFLPSVEEMYPDGNQTYVQVDGLTERLCGRSRPGHFRGVATIVAKLFLCVKPHVAVFGAKDFQQAAMVRRMVRDLLFDLQIEVAPTVREASGLAISSRNAYLTPEEKISATVLYQSLNLAESLIQSGERSCERIIAAMGSLIDAVDGTRVDYIEIVDEVDLQPVAIVDRRVVIALAVFVGQTRLIDNRVVEGGWRSFPR